MTLVKQSGRGGARPGSGRKKLPPRKTITLYLPPEVADKWQALADERGVTRTQILAELITRQEFLG